MPKVLTALKSKAGGYNQVTKVRGDVSAEWLNWGLLETCLVVGVSVWASDPGVSIDEGRLTTALTKKCSRV